MTAAPSRAAVRLRVRGWMGPLAALLASVLLFSLTTDTFLTADNVSLLLEQSVVIGLLALGQTLVVLTAGIDLANGAIAVLGTLVMARHAYDGGQPSAGIAAALALCTALGTMTGVVVTRLRLPPFIVTLGTLTVIAASGRLYSHSRNYPVKAGLLGFFGGSFRLGPLALSYGVLLMLTFYAIVEYALTQTAWGRHVRAVGNGGEAARRMGIAVDRTVVGAYAAGSLLYGLAAWAALGRIPNADANAYQTANLESVTAVVLGGTSLFGGRGSAVGTLLGTLVVAVLRSGLTQAGIDALYQEVATGFLVVLAVALDAAVRRVRP
jgi:fructose transport system permease protein